MVSSWLSWVTCRRRGEGLGGAGVDPRLRTPSLRNSGLDRMRALVLGGERCSQQMVWSVGALTQEGAGYGEGNGWDLWRGGRHGVNQWRGMFLDPQQTLPHGSNVLTLSSGHCFVQLLVCPACLLSHVRFFVTPWTVTHQAPLSMGFSRQEYWSGLLFPPPGDLPDLRI